MNHKCTGLDQHELLCVVFAFHRAAVTCWRAGISVLAPRHASSRTRSGVFFSLVGQPPDDGLGAPEKVAQFGC